MKKKKKPVTIKKGETKEEKIERIMKNLRKKNQK